MANVELEFNYPKIPDNTDDEMRRFLIELRHLLLRKLVGPGFINDITGIIVNEGIGAISAFGSFYGNEIGLVLAGGSGTFAEVADSDIAAGEIKNVTFQGNKELDIGSYNGKYLVTYAISVKATGANKHIISAIGVNVGGSGSLTAQSPGKNHFMSLGSLEFCLACCAVIDLSADSTIGVMVTNETDGNNVTVEHVSICIVRISGIIIASELAIFKTFAVSGQDNVVADSAADILTLVAGSNITLTTDESADSVTIAAAAGGTLGLFSNVEHHTSDDTLLASETGSCHTNAGASADITLTLPDNTAKGTFFFFRCLTTPGFGYTIFIYPSGNNGIYWSGFTDSPGPDGYWISTSQRSMAIGLVADGDGDWVVFTSNGSWSSQ